MISKINKNLSLTFLDLIESVLIKNKVLFEGRFAYLKIKKFLRLVINTFKSQIL